jgi:quercetin dioxygenase-like cupin family protein
MLATPVRAADARHTETPNATMITRASPTLGGSARLSVWEVRMAAGSAGPAHAFDSEQVWTVLDGRLQIALAGAPHLLDAGDTLVVPPGVARQVTATEAAHALVCGFGDAAVSVAGEDAPRGTPPWIG